MSKNLNHTIQLSSRQKKGENVTTKFNVRGTKTTLVRISISQTLKIALPNEPQIIAFHFALFKYPKHPCKSQNC